MTVSVKHSTPADGSFSTTGATAWNADHTLTGVGTMAEQDANAVAITGGSVNGATVGASTASTGAFTTLSASSTVSGTGFSTYLASPPAIGGTTASTGRFTTVQSTVATGTAPFTVASTTPVANLSIGGNAATVTNGVYTTDTGTVTNTMLAGSIANAKLTNSSITFGATAQALGSTVSGLTAVTLDNGAVGATTPAAGTFTTLIGGGGSANYEQITGGATGKAVQFQSLGSDANVSLAIQSKNTGAIDLAAGSSGVNISNGGTVTAITRTNAGGSYTSPPTVAISAPTTAGGVQATATSTLTQSVPTIVGGGTGYSVSDVLTFVGGTFTVVSTVTVTAVSSGVITAISNAAFGTYTVVPSNPISVTGGTGTGATLSTTWAMQTTFNITNAGSGYVEQPTVTFSGGGGSSAAAYATIGSNTTIKNLGNITTFATPNSNVLAIVDKNTTSYPTNSTVAFSMVPQQGNFGASYLGFGSAAYLGTTSTSSTAFQFSTSVSSPVSNGVGGLIQFGIAHTTSAVNYVQVTGGATGNPATVTISAQGSDSNVNIRLTPKATGTLLTATSATILDGTAIPAGGTAGAGYKLSSTANFGIFFGSGVPTLSAAKGSLYMRSDGSSIATRMYINTDGSTTWTNVVTAA